MEFLLKLRRFFGVLILGLSLSLPANLMFAQEAQARNIFKRIFWDAPKTLLVDGTKAIGKTFKNPKEGAKQFGRAIRNSGRQLAGRSKLDRTGKTNNVEGSSGSGSSSGSSSMKHIRIGAITQHRRAHEYNSTTEIDTDISKLSAYLDDADVSARSKAKIRRKIKSLEHRKEHLTAEVSTETTETATTSGSDTTSQYGTDTSSSSSSSTTGSTATVTTSTDASGSTSTSTITYDTGTSSVVAN